MEGMKSLFVSVPKGKNLLQQERQYQGSFDPWDICSQCEVYYTLIHDWQISN